MDLQSIGLLVLRVSIGLTFLLAHGWPKLVSFKEKFDKFADPLGIGPQLSLILIVFAEVFCSLAIIAGFKTRFAAVPPFIAMIVAAFIVHGDDPWARKELAVIYAVAFLTLLFTGAGAYSLDGKSKKAPKKSGA